MTDSSDPTKVGLDALANELHELRMELAAVEAGHSEKPYSPGRWRQMVARAAELEPLVGAYLDAMLDDEAAGEDQRTDGSEGQSVPTPVWPVERRVTTRATWFPTRASYEHLGADALAVLDDFAWTIYGLRAARLLRDAAREFPVVLDDEHARRLLQLAKQTDRVPAVVAASLVMAALDELEPTPSQAAGTGWHAVTVDRVTWQHVRDDVLAPAKRDPRRRPELDWLTDAWREDHAVVVGDRVTVELTAELYTLLLDLVGERRSELRSGLPRWPDDENAVPRVHRTRRERGIRVEKADQRSDARAVAPGASLDPDDPNTIARQIVAWLPGIPRQRVAALLGVSVRTLSRWIADSPAAPSPESARRLRVAGPLILDLAGAFTPEGIVQWFDLPHAALGGRTPAEALSDTAAAAQLRRCVTWSVSPDPS